MHHHTLEADVVVARVRFAARCGARDRLALGGDSSSEVLHGEGDKVARLRGNCQGKWVHRFEPLEATWGVPEARLYE